MTVVPVDDFEQQRSNIDSNYRYNIPRISSTKVNEFEVRMPTQITIFYVILTKLFGFNSGVATWISQMVSHRYVALIAFSTGVVPGIIKFVFDYILSHTQNTMNAIAKYGATLIMISDVVVLVSWMFMLLNVNYILIHFKRKSFVLYWKLTSVTLLVLVISYWRHEFGVGSFNKSIFTFGESCFDSVVLVLCFLMSVICFSLHQGWKVPKLVKLIAIISITFLFGSYALRHFLDQRDVTITFLQQKISIRSVIVSIAFDMMLWHLYLLYQTWKRPNVIQMVSKLDIVWVNN